MKVVVFRLSSPPWEAYALKAMSSSASVENAVPSKQTTCKMFSLLNILGGPLDVFIERFSDSPLINFLGSCWTPEACLSAHSKHSKKKAEQSAYPAVDF